MSPGLGVPSTRQEYGTRSDPTPRDPRLYYPHPGTVTGVGRAYSTSTPLGQLMADNGKIKQEFAEEIGMSSRRLTEILSGRVTIQAKYVPKICVALGCLPEDL